MCVMSCESLVLCVVLFCVCLERANEWVKCDVMYMCISTCSKLVTVCVLSISWSSELLLSFSARTEEHIQAVHDYLQHTHNI